MLSIRNLIVIDGFMDTGSKFMHDSLFHNLVEEQNRGLARGIVSVCSAHPVVLKSALDDGVARSTNVLIEATCNQVNQDGGYTGMTPAGFRDFVSGLATKAGLEPERIILGGDHLGPNPWRHRRASEAMHKAHQMVAAYAKAGFTKFHLDASMSCSDDPTPLPTEVIAKRSAELALSAESNAAGRPIVYIVGTEVPIPGGATEHLETLAATDPADAHETMRQHRDAFEKIGILPAFDRVIGLVVQPGVEFGHDNVVTYDPVLAEPLKRARNDLGIVFEAHSTDYQNTAGLSSLVRDGFAILKVGPWLTFALREALYGLDHIATELQLEVNLKAGMEAIMTRHPEHWQLHYTGDAIHQRLQRHYSYSDRIRYYWSFPEAQHLVNKLVSNFANTMIPETLISQYLTPLWPEVRDRSLQPQALPLIERSVGRILDDYAEACGHFLP